MKPKKYDLFVTCCAMIALFLLWAAPAIAELAHMDAYDVALMNDTVENGDDSMAELEMTLINKSGKQRIRKIRRYSKDYGNDEKSVLFFLEPADVKDSGFLTWAYDDAAKDDDQWLYLPAMKKVRRISSSGKAGYFMGSDFTYHDLGSADIDDYAYVLLETEVIDGIECYHLERLPKDDAVQEETGYGREELWIRPDNWMTVKVVYYDKKLKLLKEFTADELQEIDGIWTTVAMTMTQQQKKHTTVLKFSNVTYNTGIDNDMFSERRLKQGAR